MMSADICECCHDDVVKVAEDDITFKLALFKKYFHFNNNVVLGCLLAEK